LSLKKTLLLIPLLSLFLVGCGKRTKLPTDIPQFIAQTSDTTYIPLTPVWTAAGGIDFDRPQDVHFGFDGHVYIADTGNDRVVEFDQAGNFIAQYDGIEEPWSISQLSAVIPFTSSAQENKVLMQFTWGPISTTAPWWFVPILL
jgi:hypothetical protein